MANDTWPEINLLTERDLTAALELQEQLLWNQTKEDWSRLVKLNPLGCFAARDGGQLVGTVTTIAYGGELAWIGMMIVHANFRRRGIGARLMRSALEHLHNEDVANIKLDATPAGQALYESLGFASESRIERWAGVAGADSSPKGTDFHSEDVQCWRAVCCLDRQAFGADRAELLKNLIKDSPILPNLVMAATGELKGYALARRGSQAFYVGPIVARDEGTAEALLDSALHALKGETLYIDIHSDFPTSSLLLAERGFTKQRDLLRMRYGAAGNGGQSGLVFAIGGPEIG